MQPVMSYEQHLHPHTQNRFAVVPTHTRLNADPGRTGKGVTIAFLDSGFYPHPDLTQPANRIVAFEDIPGLGGPLDSAANPQGWDWHGTQTSVVACGNGYLSTGIYRGLASEANVVLVKAGAQGRITEESIARGIRWVMANKDRYGIRVLSISLGGDNENPYRESDVDDAAEEAVRSGLVVVAAAGNSGCSEKHRPVPPANSPSVLTVGGYDDRNYLAPDDSDRSRLDLYCSSYGPTSDGLQKPEIIAPAIWVAAPILPRTDLYRKAEALSRLASAPDYLLPSLCSELWLEADLPSSIAGEAPEAIRASVESQLRQYKIVSTHYQHVDGTSFAAPIVASIVAQMLEANPALSPSLVKEILISTADRIPGAAIIRQGFGVLNARRAVDGAAREQHSGAELERPGAQPSGRLVFVYHDDDATSIGLAADFNDWNPASAQLVRGPFGIWRTEIESPPPGRYRYKFVVDGHRWVEDPHNGLSEPDNYGGANSVLIVK